MRERKHLGQIYVHNKCHNLFVIFFLFFAYQNSPRIYDFYGWAFYTNLMTNPWLKCGVTLTHKCNFCSSTLPHHPSSFISIHIYISMYICVLFFFSFAAWPTLWHCLFALYGLVLATSSCCCLFCFGALKKQFTLITLSRNSGQVVRVSINKRWKYSNIYVSYRYTEQK